MSADQTEPSGSDLTKGIEVELLADGAMLLGHVGQDQVILAGLATRYLRSMQPARTTAAPSRKACWSATRYAVPGMRHAT